MRGQALVRLRRGVGEERRGNFAAEHELARLASLPALGIELVEGAGLTTEGVLGGVWGSPEVEWAEPNPACRVALAEPDDPAYHETIGGMPVQWPAYQLHALEAWSRYPGCFFEAAQRPQDAPIVALVDTGIDETHPDFMNPGATGADVGAGGQLMLSAARTFLSGQPSDLSPTARDEHGHGTHLGALVAAGTNNGVTAGDGIAGIGYPARLLPLKVAGAEGVTTHADLARAIVYAADQGASIVLVGAAGPTWSRTLQEAVDYAWERGCLLIAPMGNYQDSTPQFPASCPHVFAAGAATAWGEVAGYSGRGQVALAGPGGDEALGVYSALPTYACTLRTDPTSVDYGWLMGTSQAAAHVAAAAALYAGAADLGLETGDESGVIWRALQQTADSLVATEGGGWDDESGYGLVAPAALLAGEPRAASVGGIVGRAVRGGSPALGAVVTAARDGSEGVVTTTSVWPAGAYRIANIEVGSYRLTAEAEGKSGVWEQVWVLAGCDAPGVDFRLGSGSADAAMVSAEIPRAALRGGRLDIRVVVANTGEATWRRRDGHQLVQVTSELAARFEPDHVNLGLGEEVAPGGTAVFAASLRAPERWGLYWAAWRMCQEGGVGWFGPTAGESVSVTSFWDVPADHWAVAAIEAAKDAGIVRGYGGDVYRPAEAVSRDQMAVYIARALAGGDDGVPAGPEEPSFADVATDHWAYRYVEYVHARDIVRGYWDGYHPGELVNRAQMAVFMARAMAGGDAGVPEGPGEASFPDVGTDFWAFKYVEYIRAEGVTQGYPDGRYHPEVTCTRDQMAVYVARGFRLPM